MERRASQRWGTLGAAANRALLEAEQLAEDFATDRHEWVGSSVQMLIADDVLFRLSRPEAHLARQRNQLIEQLRAMKQRRDDAAG